jgi:hypothetical protein
LVRSLQTADEFAVKGTMKIAVISDIHGNLLALQAVLADITRRALTRQSTWATC